MQRTFARFAAAPIGPLLAARDSGLTLATTAAADINRTARSDLSHAAGTRGAEIAIDGDDALVAVFGLVNAVAPLNAYVGADANGIGWSLHTGEILVNGVVVASGLPLVAKGDMVGVRVEMGAPHTVYFYYHGAMVHTRTVAIAGDLHLGLSLASTDAGKLLAYLNAGQWGFRSEAAQAGWYLDGAVASARLSDEYFLTEGNERYLGVLEDGLTMLAGIDFWAWYGDQTQGAVAQVRVHDPKGVLDALAMSDVRGLPVSIRQANQGGTLAESEPLARFVVDRFAVEDDSYKVLTLTDAHSDLDEPLARKPFLSVPALAGQAQPVVIGAVCSVPALAANSDGTVRWLADAPLVHVGAVLDRGDPMEGGTYALTPDLQQLTMESPPVGPVVCDVSTIGAAMAPATLQQALTAIFSRRGKSAWSAADAAAIDAATGYAGIGYYTREATIRQALASILPSYGAWYWQDADGVIRFARIVAPEAYAGALAFDITGDLATEDVIAAPDPAPNLTRRMAYRLNAQVLAPSDLVTDVVDVPQWRRDELTSPWRGLAVANGPLAERYRHADAAAPMLSCFYRPEDASAEINRVIALYPVQRYFFQVAWRSDTPPPNPGSIGRLTYPRYGLDVGRKLLVKRVVPQPSTGDLQLILWG